MSTKTPVVFIPALLCDGQLYQQAIEVMGDRISAQVMLSPKPSLAESCAEILARAPETFVLVGTSYGGNLAIEIALAAPARVVGLWLMGCDPAGPVPSGPDLAGALENNPGPVIDMLSSLVVRKSDTSSAAAFKQMALRVGNAAGAAQARALSLRVDRTARLSELAMPTLLTWGADDPLVSPSIATGMAARLSNARLHVLPACGHLPTLEQPAQTAALFSAFVDALEAQS